MVRRIVKMIVCLVILFSSAADSLAQNRIWTDNTGKHKTIAEFVSIDGLTVTLIRSDGVEIEVPFERFSKSDKKYINKFRTVNSIKNTYANLIMPVVEQQDAGMRFLGPVKQAIRGGDLPDSDTNIGMGNSSSSSEAITIEPTDAASIETTPKIMDYPLATSPAQGNVYPSINPITNCHSGQNCTPCATPTYPVACCGYSMPCSVSSQTCCGVIQTITTSIHCKSDNYLWQNRTRGCKYPVWGRAAASLVGRIGNRLPFARRF